MDRFANISSWDAGVALVFGTASEMSSALAIMIAAAVFIYRSRNGPVFVKRINTLIFLIGFSLFLVDFFNVMRLLGLFFGWNWIGIVLFAFIYFFLELSTYWIFAYKYYTASS